MAKNNTTTTPATQSPAAATPATSVAFVQPAPDVQPVPPADNLPQTVQGVMTDLDDVDRLLGPPATGFDKRHHAKPRKGAAKVIQTVAALAKQQGLDSAGLSTDQMLADLGDAETLSPLEKRLATLHQGIADREYTSMASACGTMLSFYALLQHLAVNNGPLAVALEPVVQFFAYRHPAALADKPTKVQTRTQAKLRKAERAASRAKPRADAPQPGSPPPTPAPVAGNGVAAPAAAAPAPAGNGSPVAPTQGTNGHG